jgi:hypothetical protein
VIAFDRGLFTGESFPVEFLQFSYHFDLGVLFTLSGQNMRFIAYPGSLNSFIAGRWRGLQCRGERRSVFFIAPDNLAAIICPTVPGVDKFGALGDYAGGLFSIHRLDSVTCLGERRRAQP